jgi:bifunctional non-homologous end joining protein LigD
MASTSTGRDTSIRTYRAKRNFAITQEPAPIAPRGKRPAPIFVVQKHRAHRAGLHWDFRLEHDGVLWSWAVRKGPSLDPADKRIAAHVEDHPLEYADFEGTIPDGQYGAGTVELWDRGTWRPLDDPEAGMRKGEIRFVLDGKRLNGRFTLVRLKPRPAQRSRQDNWLLIKGHDEAERPGGDAPAIEQRTARPQRSRRRGSAAPPADGAVRAGLPPQQAPQLASVIDEAPGGDDWVSEIKFDGYRLLCWLDHGNVRLLTRSGLDWTERLPAVARAVAGFGADAALVDGELVALDVDGRSSFPALQAALSAGKDATLYLFLFDLLHRDGWDFSGCNLLDRKRVLVGLADWRGMVRFSDHQRGDAERMLSEACAMGLEGIICKEIAAPYRAGRGRAWLKVKCHNREEFVVLGWTPPGGSRTGLGALHLGYYDTQGKLHYAGGVGTGFSDDELAQLSRRLGELAVGPPKALIFAGEPLPRNISWVRPELIAEVQYAAWSGAGRVRQAVYKGLREDKEATEVVRDAADPEADRKTGRSRASKQTPASHGAAVSVPPRRGRAVVASQPPRRGSVTVGVVTLTHPDRELWPGITKQDLAHYWQLVAPHALHGLAHRPLAIVRCPEGIGGEHFFQKHGHGALPSVVRQGEADGQPYLVIDDADGLIAMAQISAIELHAWGAAEADPLRPDRIVFDLDPGEGVSFASVARAALDVRDRLQRLGLVAFCRTTGGKGLHVVVPLEPVADWDRVKPFCRTFAEALSEEQPDRFLSTVRKLDRRGRILIDWLRNGLGATAIASFSPRARDGAGVAMPIAWDEVGPKLDPARFTLRSVAGHLDRRRKDPWEQLASLRQRLPDLAARPRDLSRSTPPERSSNIVTATRPKRRS